MPVPKAVRNLFMEWRKEYVPQEGGYVQRLRVRPWVGNVVAFLVVLAVGCGILAGVYFGGGAIAHIETHEGSHIGYISAVERGGIFYDTTSVYIKTDLESSQEDKYCTNSAAVRSQLEDAAEAGSRVKIYFESHLGWAKGCTWGEGAGNIIRIEVLP